MSLRVLHILDSDLDFQSWRIADDLARTVGAEMQIDRHVVGMSGDDRGIAGATLRLRRRRDLDVVHTFGKRALIAAALGAKAPIVHSLSPEASDTEVRWLRAIRGHRPIRVVASSDWDMRRIEQTEVIRPGVDFSRIRPRRDAKLREALGFAEDDYVILAAGESTRRTGHELALWTCGILSELHERYKLLLWGRGPRAPELMRRGRPWRQPNMRRFAEAVLGRRVEFEELLTAADLVLVTAEDGAATLPVALSMAAGLPIVSVVNRTTSELLEDRHTAAMVGKSRGGVGLKNKGESGSSGYLRPGVLVRAEPVPKTRARDLARRILDLRSDAALQWHIADQARAEAYEHFSLSKSIEKWRELYEATNVGASATLVKPNL